MAEVRARAGGSSKVVLKGTTCFAAAPQFCVSKNQPSPPQAWGFPLEPNPFRSRVTLINNEQITYSSSGRDLRDREGVLAGQNWDNNS